MKYFSVEQEKPKKFKTLTLLIIIHIYLNHIAACIMMTIVWNEHLNGVPDNMGIVMNNYYVKSQVPFLEQGPLSLYINFLY